MVDICICDFHNPGKHDFQNVSIHGITSILGRHFLSIWITNKRLKKGTEGGGDLVKVSISKTNWAKLRSLQKKVKWPKLGVSFIIQVIQE